jgi:hypothetical protein
MRSAFLRSPHTAWTLVVAVVLCGWLRSSQQFKRELELQSDHTRTAEAEAQSLRDMLGVSYYLTRMQKRWSTSDLPKDLEECSRTACR